MAKRQQVPPKSFDEALAELEALLAEVEAGQVGLEDSMAKYERGAFLVQHCRGVLAVAEKQIEQLTRTPDGGIQRQPLETSSTGPAESPEADSASADAE